MAKNSVARTIKFLKNRPDNKRNKRYEKQLKSAIIYKVSRKIWRKVLSLNVLPQIELFELPGDNFILEFYPSMNVGKGLGVEFMHFMRYSDKTKFDFPPQEEYDNNVAKLFCDDVSIRICFRRGSFFPALVKMAIKNKSLYSHQRTKSPGGKRRSGWNRLMNFKQEQDGDHIAPFVVLGLQTIHLLSEQSKL